MACDLRLNRHLQGGGSDALTGFAPQLGRFEAARDATVLKFQYFSDFVLNVQSQICCG